MLQRLLSKLVPPFEVRATCGEIVTFLEKNAFLCKDIVEAHALALAKDAKKTIYSVRIDGTKPDHLALMLITNVLGNHISSGHFHLYRGILNMVGTDMLKVWNAAASTMLEKGYCTESEAEEDRKWIREQIKNAG